MSTKSKIFIFLIIVLLIVFIYLIIEQDKRNNNENLTVSQNNDGDAEISKPVDIGLLARTYKAEIKVILNNYSRQPQDKSLIATDDINRIKNSLLSLKMSNEFKELHLNLVLAMDKMEDYLVNGDEEKLQESDRLISQMKKEYEWLK